MRSKLTKNRSLNGTNRRGFTLFELMISGALLATVMVTLVPLLQWISLERRKGHLRQLAQQECANILEHLSTQPWNNINAEQAKGVELSASVQKDLRKPELEIHVIESSAPLPAKKIAVQLSWNNRAGVQMAPVRLTSWRYQQKGE